MLKPSGLKAKILIIDDDADIRESIQLALEDQPILAISFWQAKDVEAGLKLLKKHQPDLVIIDLHMPGKSGFDFMDILQKDETFKAVRILMLTADNTLSNLFKAEDKGHGRYDYLAKPFNITDLQAFVYGMLITDKPEAPKPRQTD